MSRLSPLALLTVLCFCPTAFADKPAAAPSPATPQQVYQSVKRSLKYLQAESTSWLNTRKCAACHHVALPLWSMIEAERQGYSVDKKFVTETADRTLGSREKMIGSRILPDPKGKPDTRPGSNMGIVFVAIAGRALPLLSEGQKQSLKLIAAEIPKKQEKNGSWKSVDDRIPIHESPAIDTAWSIMAMEAGTDASKPSPERDAIAKAKAWLDGQAPTSLQSKVFKIWMALREKKTRAQLQPSIGELLALQQPDGGWRQVPKMASDAYATGQTLYVLGLAGFTADQPQIKRGIDFLIANQKPDGSWPMIARAETKNGCRAQVERAIITRTATAISKIMTDWLA
jgi:Prenyltransferase and squalene oxidase repeat